MIALLLVGALAITGCEKTGTTALPEAREHTVTGPLQNRASARLFVPDASSRVHVVLANLPGLLYRITTPAGSGLKPRVVRRGGLVRLGLLPTGGKGPDEVRIVLNRTVRWDLRFPAGAGEQRFDLSRGRITRLDLGTAGLIELRLPEPGGTVPLTFTGSVGTLSVTAPRSTPLRLYLAGGVGSALTPWTADEQLPPATALAPAIWPTARDRYWLRVRAPVGLLSLTRAETAAR
ncbi:hypothetical protein M1L60_41035 [Actinoplanes sp. TRM 88003]|uniref:Lipoprotein n=1 Tax=Paractinoplanes aksuensis TaxID=2939490 RepID=A0ABT1E1L3_9ACTN|nr:hypothetical protein [Actinoplanes aksuensis]MCO8276983.1 hypothetical protein [Actinoplanes aksuensis]